jgi:osmotically-inducible protein OsmY
MKSIAVGVLVAGAAVATVAETMDVSDGVGNFVEASTISTKVTAKLAGEHNSALTNVRVAADASGVVRLTGTAPNKMSSELAENLTRLVTGVTAIRNDISLTDAARHRPENPL